MDIKDKYDLYKKFDNGEISEDELTDEEKAIITEMYKSEISQIENEIISGTVELKQIKKKTAEVIETLPEDNPTRAELEEEFRRLFLKCLEEDDDFDDDEIATEEEMKAEAIRRIEFLIENIGLNPKVLTYFKEDRLYYSYCTANGFWPCIDTITYDPEYEAAVRNFEKEYNALVYHCVETLSPFGKLLVMLHVSQYKEDWPEEMPAANGEVLANVHNSDENSDEIGYVKFTSDNGALIQIG